MISTPDSLAFLVLADSTPLSLTNIVTSFVKLDLVTYPSSCSLAFASALVLKLLSLPLIHTTPFDTTTTLGAVEFESQKVEG